MGSMSWYLPSWRTGAGFYASAGPGREGLLAPWKEPGPAVPLLGEEKAVRASLAATIQTG